MSSNRSDSSGGSVQILVAEEDEDLRATIAAALRDDGHSVVECADGAALFRELEHRVAGPGARKTLIIAQARLPGLGALRILHSLRALDVPIPMVLMTWLREPSLPAILEKAGASALLTKPIQLEELRRVVDSMLRPMRGAAADLLADELVGVS